MYKNELEIDIGRCVVALLRRGKFIAVITVLFLLVGVALTLNVGEDQYTATATVYAASDGSVADTTNAVTAMNAYLNVAKSYKVSQRAALIMGRSEITAADVQAAMYVSSSATTTSSTAVSNFMNSSATIISFNATTTDPNAKYTISDNAKSLQKGDNDVNITNKRRNTKQA